MAAGHEEAAVVFIKAAAAEAHSDRLPIRDAARGRNSRAGPAHQHTCKRMDGGHHTGTTRQGCSTTRTHQAAESDEKRRPTRRL